MDIGAVTTSPEKKNVRSENRQPPANSALEWQRADSVAREYFTCRSTQVCVCIQFVVMLGGFYHRLVQDAECMCYLKPRRGGAAYLLVRCHLSSTTFCECHIEHEWNYVRRMLAQIRNGPILAWYRTFTVKQFTSL